MIMIDFIVRNWYIIFSFIAIIIVAIVCVVNFFKQPTSEQIRQVREWLLYAVTEVEKIMGSKTGQLKLRMVYDMFLEKFPFISSVISFDKFSELVDEALEKMKHLLSTNEAIRNYVGYELTSKDTEPEVTE